MHAYFIELFILRNKIIYIKREYLKTILVQTYFMKALNIFCNVYESTI